MESNQNRITDSSLLNIGEKDRCTQVVESLLSKPMTKPDFSQALNFSTSNSVLKQAQQFLPEFARQTDQILNDPFLLHKANIEMQIQQLEDMNQQEAKPENLNQMQCEQTDGKQRINMEIGVGVFDVLNADKNIEDGIEKSIVNQLPVSTEQIVKISNQDLYNENKKKQKGESCSSSDDDDSDLYVAFDSSDDEGKIIEKIKGIKPTENAEDC